MIGLRREKKQIGALALGLLGVLLLCCPAMAETTLKVIPHGDLQVLDPVVSAATITADHSYMVYDQLFALDDAYKPQPQMIDSWSLTDDHLKYRFTLRAGLLFHDGGPVTAEDCVASIKRWAVRDGTGQLMMKIVEDIKVIDEKTFEIALRQPFPLMLEALAKPTANLLPIMPKRFAETDASKPVTEPIGSGPFLFAKDEWVPGSKIVYRRFDRYVPRDEPARGFAGGKVAKVDRVEWHIVRDPFTALNGIRSGEFDFWEQPPLDVSISARTMKGVHVKVVNTLGDHGVFRINHLQPPFNHASARQALLRIAKQTDFLQAIASDPDFFRTCN